MAKDRTQALFDAVYADPAADGPRLVLADHLQELGDPRGELIALQLAKLTRTPTAAATRRERTLLEEHERAWLGPLEVVVRDSTWARGFLETVLADFSEGVPADPSWNTVRSLEIGGYPPDVGVLGAGCFGALVELSTISLDDVPTVLEARPQPPLETLSVKGPRTIDDAWDPQHLALVERLVELPKLRRLRMWIARHPWDAGQLDWLWNSKVVAQLADLELEVDLPLDLAGCLPGLATTRLESFALTHSYFTCRLTRDDSGALSRLTVTWHGGNNAGSYLMYVTQTVGALPADVLTAFRFDHPKARWPASALVPLTDAVARQTRIKPKR